MHAAIPSDTLGIREAIHTAPVNVTVLSTSVRGHTNDGGERFCPVKSWAVLATAVFHELLQ